MPDLQKFGLSSTAIEEWLPWGGLVQEHIMKQKDWSLFAVLSYAPYTFDLNQTERIAALTSIQFCKGWTLWNEHQDTGDGKGKDYLVVCWNPFVAFGDRYAGNPLPGDKVAAKDTVSYFASVLERIQKLIGTFTTASYLTYQDFLDFLSFSLSQGQDKKEMPEIPLYLDALLSEDVDIQFGKNSISIGGKQLYLVSLLGVDNAEIQSFYPAFQGKSFRHTRRLVCFSEKEAKREFLRYTKGWFPGRKLLRKQATGDLLGKYNGYFMDTLQFLLDPDELEAFRPFFRHLLDVQQCSYIEEDFNLKEIFWGCIPGLFLANTRGPVQGFPYLSDFLTTKRIEKIVHQDILKDAKSNLVPTSVDVQQYLSSEE